MSIGMKTKLALAVALLAAGVAQAASVEKGYPTNEPAIPSSETQKFLDNVRTYGNGQPSPTIVYSTGGIAEATNSPEALRGPSVTSTGTPPEHKTMGSSSLRGGTLERRTNQPYQIPPGVLERRSVQPPPVQSTWQ